MAMGDVFHVVDDLMLEVRDDSPGCVFLFATRKERWAVCGHS